MRIVYAGTPDFAVPALAALLRSRHEIVGVLTQPDRPKGRGQQVATTPVKRTALASGIAVSQPRTLKAEDERATLVSWKPDVIIVVAYGLILPQAVLDLPRFGCLNIHASLLPRWRGAAPIQRAILAGDRETGVSIMLMDAGLDTGPVLLEERVVIAPAETAGKLHDRLATLGASALLRVLDGLDGEAPDARPQAVEGVTYASKIDKAEALVDWRRSAQEIVRKVRAFHPWPVAETRLGGEQLRIHAAHVLAEDASEYSGSTAPRGNDRPSEVPRANDPGANNAGGNDPGASVPCANNAGANDPRADDHAGNDPGTIVGVTADGLIVSSGRGSVVLTEIQRPGRKRVAARDFANSQQIVGRRFDQRTT